MIAYIQQTDTILRKNMSEKAYLILENGKERIGIEFKTNTAPKVSTGFWNCIEDLNLSKVYIVCPIEDSYLHKENVIICGPKQTIESILTYFI